MNPTAKKYPAPRTRFNQRKLALVIAAQIYALSAYAGPTGGEIVGGAGKIEQQGTETTIVQSTDRLAIDWQSFDVAKNERVEFVQPGQTAVALNRILGNKGTEILGQIDANGHVILVNPRGVVFGESATINAGGLIASGLQVNPDDFMNGDLVFKRIEGTDGTVINSGMINAAAGGNVALLGKQVENGGLISANLGSVILASGKEAVLTFDETGLLGVQVDEALLQSELGESAAVLNTGEIRAENGRILLSATTTRDVFSQAVNWGDQKQARSVTYNDDGSFTLGAGGDVVNSGNIISSGENSAGDIVVLGKNITSSGAIHADAIYGGGGHVELHSNTTTKIIADGVVTANGKEGGNIKLLGKNVGLFDRAAVEAIGNNGGGTILAGGDREGLNTQIRNADFVYVNEAASIDVSATENGDGGTAIIFAEDTARIYGQISAKGGEAGGDGGFVETSGKRGFSIKNAPDVSAATGSWGHWLIDPYNITVASEGFVGLNPQGEFVSGSNDSMVGVDVIAGVLSGGGDVTLKTGGEGGNITVSSQINVNPSGNATLNLRAHNDIIINANIQATGTSALNLNLHANRSQNEDNEGGIKFDDTITIRTNGGDFKIGHINDDGSIDTSMPGAYDVDFTNVTIDVTGPSYEDLETLNTHFGGRSIDGDRDEYLKNSGRIVVNANHDVNLGGSDPDNRQNSHKGDVTMMVSGREQDRVLADEDAPEKIYIIAGNDIKLDNGRVWTYDNNPTENPRSGSDGSPYDGFTTLKLQAGNDIDLQGNIIYAWNQQAGGGEGQEHNDRLMIDLTAGGNISIDGDIDTTGGDFTVGEAVNVDFSGQTIDTRSRYGAGDVSIEATGDITLGNMPMFNDNESAGELRNPGFKAIAGRTLTLDDDLSTLDKDIQLGASLWAFDGNTLETRDGGNILLATGGDLMLPSINSSGNVTLSSLNENAVFTITGDGEELSLSGTLILNLQDGSAELADVVNNADGDAINLVITSGQNIDLQTEQTLNLGNSTVSGSLTLSSGEDILQQEGTLLNVSGLSHFAVGEGSIVLNQDGNIFGSFDENDEFTSSAILINGEDAEAVEIASSQVLLLGAVDSEMRIGGSLVLKSSEAIAQLGALSVGGATDLSAPSIILDQENTLTSLGITEAQSVELRNAQNLELSDIVNTDTLNLSVDGELTQSAGSSLDLQTLSLNGNLAARLTQTNNQIGNLSGDIFGGNIVSSGAVNVNDFTIADVTTVSASDIDIVGQIQLNDEATLTFNDVEVFHFHGGFQGGDAEVNSVTVNGDANDGIYTLYNTAIWQDVAITINGGEGDDTLAGPDLETDWIFGGSFQLLADSQILTFSAMERLHGGSEVDEFRFLNGAIPSLTLVGGGGEDVADYSETEGLVEVFLSDVAGLQEIELIRGNNNGEGIYNSALIAEGDLRYTWTVSALNSGTVVSGENPTVVFENFNQLRGGGGVDQFVLQADLIGGNAQADGGAGDDIFDVDVDFTANLIGGEGSDRFNLAAAASGELLGGNGNDTFALTAGSRAVNLDGGDGQNTLLGFDAALQWSVVETVGDESTIVVGVTDGTTNFVAQASNITALQGSDSNDTFMFSVANSGVGVDGGKGINTADFSGITTNHTVSLGALEEHGISNVTEIVGNAAGGFVSALEIAGSDGGIWTLDAADSGTVVRGTEEITFQNFNEFWGGEGNDSFLISASPAGSIDGRGGDDLFRILAPGLTATLDGGDGEDELIANDSTENDWEISAEGSRLWNSAADTLLIKFAGMEILRGAENYADSFSVLDGVEAQPTIFAGDGNAADTIDYSRLTELPINVVLGDAGLSGFESVIGNSDHILTGADEDNVWELTEAGGSVSWIEGDEGKKTEFSGFGYWVGGSANDSFRLETFTGAPLSIDGASGENTVDMSAVDSEVHIGLGGADGLLALLNIDDISANPLHANRLTSGAEQAAWTINDINAGILAQDDAPIITFSGFHHLEGEQGNVFNLEAGGYLGGETSIGSVIGGTGTSVLNARGDDAQTWIVSGAGQGSLVREGLAEGTPVLAFNGMTTLNGGGGADDFVLTAAGASIGSINGGGGNNSLRADFSSNSTLAWVADGSGDSVTGVVGRYQNITSLYGQAGADVFKVGGATELDLIDSGAGNDSIQLIDTSRVDLILAGAGADVIEILGNASVAEPIDGGEGDDTLDLTELNRAVIWNAVDQNIGGFDYLNIENFHAPANFTNTFQAPDGNNIWTITGADSGRLETDGQVVTYQAIANLLGGSMEDLFVLTAESSVSGEIDGGDGNNTLRGDNTDSEWTLSALDTGRLGDRVAFKGIDNLTGGSGADQFTIEEQGVLTGVLEGGVGSDSLTSARQQQIWSLSGGAKGTIAASDGESFLAFSGVEALEGSGDDRLFGSDIDTLWTINGPGAGNLITDGTTLTFTGFFQVLGGEGKDDFIISGDGSLDGAIDGGGGVDNTLMIERDDDVIVSLDPERAIEVDDGIEVINVLRIQDIEAVNGDSNRLYGAGNNEAGYSWSIDGDKSGTVSPDGITDVKVTFSNFARLFGGDKSDSFGIEAGGSVLSIDGGDGDDFVDRSSHESDLYITIGDSLDPSGTLTISSIEGLVGNDDGDPENRWRATLSAEGGNNVWTIGEANASQDGINDGVFKQGDTELKFRNFSHLQGGTGDDTFVVKDQGMLTGSIVDASGFNQLDLSEIDATRSLQAVLFTGVYTADARMDTLHIQGIDDITGAGLATTLVGADISNRWEINSTDEGRVTYTGGETDFRNIGHLYGGGSDDNFIVGPAGSLSGWLAGGAGADSIQFNGQQLRSVWLASASGVGPADGQSWSRVRTDVETLTSSQTNARNRLRLESEELASWKIAEPNKGAVAGVEFERFGELIGGNGDDVFVFGANGRLTGLVDGGAGNNTVDLIALTEGVTVAMGTRANVDLQIANIQSLNANPDTASQNRLWGLDQATEWVVSKPDEGNIRGGMSFTGFGNLTGGSADDYFEFLPAGKLSGQIDGGNQSQGGSDTVDYASVVGEWEVDLSGNADFINIEQLIGNGTTTLQGPNMQADWVFSKGINEGEMSYREGQTLSFIGINNVIGGDQFDDFRFSGGALITNGVSGGDGDDHFSVAPGTGSRNQATWLTGGGGSDHLEFVGGGEGWTGTYGPNTDGAPMFWFTAPDAQTPGMGIGYSGMASVLVDSELAQMTLKGREADMDAYRLGGGFWQWGSLLAVNYRETVQSISVVSDTAADTVAIAGPISLGGTLHLNGGTVVIESDERISARDLVLEGLYGAGTVDRPINTAVGSLKLVNNLSSVHLREANDLVLQGVTGEENVNLHLVTGNLTQQDAINTGGDIHLVAQAGAIQLDNKNNMLSGVLSLDAAARAVINNSVDTQLGEVKAREFEVTSIGAIHADGAVQVTDVTRLSSGGDIDLSALENNSRELSAQATGNIHVVDSNALILSNLVSEEGNIHVVTQDTQGVGLLSAHQGEVHLDSGGSLVDWNGPESNIRAQRFWARAVTGIGSNAVPLGLEVASVDLVNQQNTVALTNTGPLTIERIHNGGDISLINSTDVTFLKESVNAFHGTEDAQYPPIDEREMPNYGGNFLLNITIGNIKTDGSVVLAQPHIAAKTVTILNPHGVFLPPSPVIYAPEKLKITSGRSRNRPYWGLDVMPNDIEDDTKYYGDVVGAGEQLIEVESLADIDPAIFTPVRNYVYQDVSIRLPSDQLYEDEED